MRWQIWLAFLALSAAAHQVQASPQFGIGDCDGCMSWDEALNTPGLITPGNGLTGPEDIFYNDIPGHSAQFSPPELYVADVTGQAGEEYNALVMSWNPVGDPNDGLSVAAWEYNYPADPDLTGTRIELSLFFPPGIWDFSIELVDVNGWVRGWFVDVMAAGIAANTWNTISLDPGKLFPQGFIPGPIQDPLFDLTKVATIRLDEGGMNSAVFPSPPPGGSITGQWNAWNHLKVVPEPGSLLLLSIGIAGARFARRRFAG